MMMPGSFQPHMALALAMIALVSGVLLFNKAATQADFFCKKTGKTVGGLVMVLSVLSILCTLYLTCRNYRAGRGMMQHWSHPAMPGMEGMEGMPMMPDNAPAEQ